MGRSEKQKDQSTGRAAGIAALFLILVPAFCMARQPEQIIGYVFPQDNLLKSTDIAAEKLTCINYAFANIRGGRMVEGFAHDAENFAVLNGLKSRNADLKILVSVGGWTWSGAFSDMALTKASRAVFIESAAAFVKKYKLDGLDIDWEYPGLVGNGNVFRPEDKQNYTALLKELRKAFDKEEKRMHRRLYSSVATGANEDFAAHTELRKVARAVDTVNLMSYDYYEPTDDKVAGNHAPLYTDPADPKHISADASVKLYLRAGVPASKLVLGVPFYGHAWRTAGLFQTAVGMEVPADLSAAAGFVRQWDSAASAPYLYNQVTSVFVSYDDPESLAAKCAYVSKQKLAGVMFWDYASDGNGTLLDAVYKAVNKTQ